jgi:hypothetical protein
VFSGFGVGRLLDPLGIFAMAQRFARSVADPVTEAVSWLIQQSYERAWPDAPAFTARPWVQQHLDDVANCMARTPDWLFGRVTAQLQAGITQGESIPAMAERVEEQLLAGGADVWQGRATTIARTEALSAYNGGTDQAMRVMSEELGLELEKVWLASMDTRTRDTHFEADGQRAPLTGSFVVGGFSCLMPGDESLPAALRVNCRCSVLYVEPGEDVDMANRGFRGNAATGREVRSRAGRGVVRARDL